MTTVREALADVESRLFDSGLASPQANARILLTHTLGVGPGLLALHLDDAIDEEALRNLDEMTERRVAGEPLQYITGSAPFRYLELETAPGVFIPRPETEMVVQAALDRVAEVEEPRVLDLCCGSGTIAISIACELSDAQVTAIDMSPDAVALATRNAEASGVIDRVRILEGNLFGALDADADGTPDDGDGFFDLVVSNPPYIPTAKLVAMPGEIVDWEPMRALDGGEDGLDVFREIVAGIAGFLRRGGWFVCELDEDMVDEAVRQLGEDGRFEDIAAIDDLAGRPRAVAARLR